jgi:LuxR family transcriptional regulator, maltose regulon positive regulatory protein
LLAERPHVVAALDPVCPGIAGQLGPLFGPPSPRAFEGLVAALINELATGQDPMLFVLDDYHLIEAPQVHASLGSLLEHRPLGLRLVLSSRADPPLPLARLRARRRGHHSRAAPRVIFIHQQPVSARALPAPC